MFCKPTETEYFSSKLAKVRFAWPSKSFAGMISFHPFTWMCSASFVLLLLALHGCAAISRQQNPSENESQRSVTGHAEKHLIQAVLDRDAARVQSLLSAGVNPDAKEKGETAHLGRNTALNFATSDDSIDIVLLLLEHGADVNARGYLGRTPLFQARSLPSTGLLLNAGAEVDARDDLGQTPLMQVNYEVARLLIEHGGNVNATDREGFTALSISAEFGEATKIRLLLSNGADVHLSARNGWTAIIAAAARTDSEVVEILLEHGAGPNDKMADGFTALMRAVALNSLASARLLLKHGANPNARMKDGRTALSLALSSNSRYGSHKEMIELLKKVGGRS